MAPDDRLPSELTAAMQRLDDLVQRFEAHPDPVVQACAFELLQCVDAVHRAGIGRLAGLLAAAGLTERALADPIVALLFELYGLVEGHESIETTPRPVATPPPGFIPLSSIQIRRRPRLTWHPALQTDDVPDGTVRSLQVGGEHAIITHLGDDFYAYRHTCPGTPLPLDGALVDNSTLICPWHGCRFDLRDGRRLDGAGPGLEALPVAVEDGSVRVAIPEGAAA